MRESRIYKSSGIVLKRRSTGEADRMLTILTKEYGKLRVLAKGVRKTTSRRGPHLEVFSLVSLVIHRGRHVDTVSEADTQHTFSHLRKDLQRISKAYCLCELVEVLLPERQEHRDVFVLLLEALETLETGEALDRDRFALELLRRLGYIRADTPLASGRIQPFIESIIQRRLKTPKFLG